MDMVLICWAAGLLNFFFSSSARAQRAAKFFRFLGYG
jgi:hypothetical protein